MIEGRDLIGQIIRLEPKRERTAQPPLIANNNQTALLWATMNNIQHPRYKPEVEVHV